MSELSLSPANPLSRWKSIWLGAKIFCLSLVREFKAAGCQKSAAALTYMTLFALVPMLTVMYSIFSIIPAFESVGQQFQSALFANLLPESSSSVENYLTSFSNQARKLTLPGVVMLFITAFLMLTNIEKSFNTIWGVGQPRRGMFKYLRYWAVLSVGPILLATTFAMSTYVISLELIFDQYDPIGLVPLLFKLLPVIIMTMVFTLLFTAVPNCRVPFKYALAGGFITAVCFETLKALFGLLVANSSFELIYGAFAVVPLFLIWLNLLWTIVLSGAILVRTLAERDYVHVHGRKTDLVVALECLALFQQRYHTGGNMRDKDCYRLGMGVVHWQRLRECFMQAGWIVETASGNYVLARDLAKLSLWDLTTVLDIKLADLGKMISKIPEAPWATTFKALRETAASDAKSTLSIPLEQLLTGKHNPPEVKA